MEWRCVFIVSFRLRSELRTRNSCPPINGSQLECDDSHKQIPARTSSLGRHGLCIGWRMRGERQLAFHRGAHQQLHRQGPARHTHRLAFVVAHLHLRVWQRLHFVREGFRGLLLSTLPFHGTLPHGVCLAHVHALPECHRAILRNERSGRIGAAEDKHVADWGAAFRATLRCPHDSGANRSTAIVAVSDCRERREKECNFATLFPRPTHITCVLRHILDECADGGADKELRRKVFVLFPP